MKKCISKIVLFSCLLVLLGHVELHAQEVLPKVMVDTNAMLIGDQTTVTLQLNTTPDVDVIWPRYQDTLVAALEIVRQSPVDTVIAKDAVNYSQQLTITSFDTGLFVIPPVSFKYKNKGDSLWRAVQSVALPLEIRTVAVDTTKAIKDIKPIQAPPVTFSDYLPYILIGLVIIVIVIFIIVLVKRKRANQPLLGRRPKPKAPAHISAIKALEELKHKKLWQSGKVKEYHSDLSFIARIYIEERFGIAALEMVTDEIAEALKIPTINDQIQAKVLELFTLADLVKFAKYEPLPLDHDTSWNYAYDFVQETKPALHVAQNGSDQDAIHEVVKEKGEGHVE